MKKIITGALSGVLFLFCITSISPAASDYPSGPITIINPMAPGGSRDIIARAFASVAEKILGQPVVVANKPGATGMIGGLAGAQAAPDGYTLTIGSSGDSYALQWEIANKRKPAYTPTDFVTIGAFTLSPTLVSVPYNSPWKTMADFIKDSKAKPGQYAFSSGGMYGIDHVSVELLSRALGLRFRHVPYKGGGPALNAVVGGQVDFSTPFPSTTIPLVRGNKLRVLAVQGAYRYKSIPEVPTLKELGVKDVECYLWVGLWAPQRTPMAILEKLRNVSAAVAKDKKFIETIENLGDEVRFLDGNELAIQWKDDSEKIARLMADLAKEAQKTITK